MDADVQWCEGYDRGREVERADLLAAGWVPPEEAEALRDELRIANERGDGWRHAFNEDTQELINAGVALTAAEARVREIESSWIRPERVEEIDCPLCEGDGVVEGGTGPIPCEVCGGSGKLRIVRAE